MEEKMNGRERNKSIMVFSVYYSISISHYDYAYTGWCS